MLISSWGMAVPSILADDTPVQSVPTSRPAKERDKAIENILLYLGRIAEIDNSQCRVFAAKLSAVVSKHGIQLPESLAKLNDKAGVTGKLTEQQFEKFGVATQGFVSASAYGRAKDPSQAQSLHKLKVDLLMTVARQYPFSFYRLSAAKVLGGWTFPDGELKRPIEEMIAPEVAAKAADAALMHTLRIAANDDRLVKNMFWKISVIQVARYSVMLPAMDSGSFTKDSLADPVKKVLAKIESFEKDGNSEEFKKVLALMKKQTQDLLTNDAVIEEVNATLKAVALVKDFLEAVNKEDKVAAAKLTTKKMAQKILAEKSLRAAVGGRPNVTSVRLVSIAPVGQLGEQPHVEVLLRVTDAKGKSSTLKTMFPLTKSKTGLLIGGK